MNGVEKPKGAAVLALKPGSDPVPDLAHCWFVAGELKCVVENLLCDLASPEKYEYYLVPTSLSDRTAIGVVLKSASKIRVDNYRAQPLIWASDNLLIPANAQLAIPVSRSELEGMFPEAFSFLSACGELIRFEASNRLFFWQLFRFPKPGLNTFFKPENPRSQIGVEVGVVAKSPATKKASAKKSEFKQSSDSDLTAEPLDSAEDQQATFDPQEDAPEDKQSEDKQSEDRQPEAAESDSIDSDIESEQRSFKSTEINTSKDNEQSSNSDQTATDSGWFGWAKKLIFRSASQSGSDSSSQQSPGIKRRQSRDAPGKELDELVKMLEDDPVKALEFAISIDLNSENRNSSKHYRDLENKSLKRHKVDLDFRNNSTARSGFGLDPVDVIELKRSYKRAAQQLVRDGEIVEAAYIHSSLLGSHNVAATLLEVHKKYREAAELIEHRLGDKRRAAKNYCLAGDYERAIEIFESEKHWFELAEVYAQLDQPQKARENYLKAADQSVRRRQFIRAAEIYEYSLSNHELTEQVLKHSWPNEVEAPECIKHLFEYYQRHDLDQKARATAAHLYSVEPPLPNIANSVQALSDVYAEAESSEIRNALEPVIKKYAERRLGTANSKETKQILQSLAKLNSDDDLYQNDCRRGSGSPEILWAHKKQEVEFDLPAGHYLDCLRVGSAYWALALNEALQPFIVNFDLSGQVAMSRWSMTAPFAKYSWQRGQLFSGSHGDLSVLIPGFGPLPELELNSLYQSVPEPTLQFFGNSNTQPQQFRRALTPHIFERRTAIASVAHGSLCWSVVLPTQSESELILNCENMSTGEVVASAFIEVPKKLKHFFSFVDSGEQDHGRREQIWWLPRHISLAVDGEFVFLSVGASVFRIHDGKITDAIRLEEPILDLEILHFRSHPGLLITTESCFYQASDYLRLQAINTLSSSVAVRASCVYKKGKRVVARADRIETCDLAGHQHWIERVLNRDNSKTCWLDFDARFQVLCLLDTDGRVVTLSIR